MGPGGKSFCRRGEIMRYRKIELGQATLREYVPERVSTVVIVSVKVRGRDEINSQANQIVI
jgi:hypothetical protein